MKFNSIDEDFKDFILKNLARKDYFRAVDKFEKLRLDFNTTTQYTLNKH